jgi:hypothetical protein
MPTLTLPLGGPDTHPTSVDGSKLGQVTVKIVVNPTSFSDRNYGLIAPEYPIADAAQEALSGLQAAPGAKRCYIAVEEGTFCLGTRTSDAQANRRADRKFGFDVSISSGKAISADGLKFAFFLDDHYVDYLFVMRNELLANPPSGTPAWECRVDKCGRYEDGEWFARDFQFSEILFRKCLFSEWAP